MSIQEPPARAYLAELLGTALLLATIVGSGIMAQNLSAGNLGVALLANAIATGAALFALIVSFASLSGAHFNPVVTLTASVGRQLPWNRVPGYLVAQFGGAILGVIMAHAMFGLELIQQSQHVRSGMPQAFSELVATFGLLLVIGATSRRSPSTTPAAVALYIVAAYWFTASTSFANPAVTVARSLTDTFAGIRPTDMVAFITAQVSGGVVAWVVVGGLFPVRDQPT